MKKNLVATALALAFLLTAAPPASAGKLAGATFADAVEVDGERLVLNGLGLREKFFVDVYVAGLYLPAKQRSEQSIFAADKPRQVVMHFLRDVTKDQICDAWKESLAANRPNASPSLTRQFEALCSYMEDVAAGDRMVFTYLPAEGTTVTVDGQEKGTLGNKAFADALFASWIGQHPATEKLKRGMLDG